MKVLYLSLKTRWFYMIKSGIKKEEYRENNHYWAFRLFHCISEERKSACKAAAAKNPARDTCATCPLAVAQDFDVIEFSLGYPTKNDVERRFRVHYEGITLGRGNEKWGAPNDRDVLKLELGGIL